MHFLSKLALVAGVALCAASSAWAEQLKLHADLEIFPTTFKNAENCIQGVMLLEKHFTTINFLGAAGWRTLYTSAPYEKDKIWQYVNEDTWDLITEESTFARIGVMKSSMQQAATLVISTNNGADRKIKQVPAEQIFAHLTNKCYTTFKTQPFDEETIFELSESLIGPGGQDFGWNAYEKLEVKMDYDGNRL